MAGAARQQAITWTNIDSDRSRRMAPLGHGDSVMLLYWGIVGYGARFTNMICFNPNMDK